MQGNTVQQSCSCVNFLCQLCVRENISRSSTTYCEGSFICSTCRCKTANLQNVEKAKSMEESILREAWTTFSQKRYNNFNIILKQRQSLVLLWAGIVYLNDSQIGALETVRRNLSNPKINLSENPVAAYLNEHGLEEYMHENIIENENRIAAIKAAREDMVRHKDNVLIQEVILYLEAELKAPLNPLLKFTMDVNSASIDMLRLDITRLFLWRKRGDRLIPFGPLAVLTVPRNRLLERWALKKLLDESSRDDTGEININHTSDYYGIKIANNNQTRIDFRTPEMKDIFAVAKRNHAGKEEAYLKNYCQGPILSVLSATIRIARENHPTIEEEDVEEEVEDVAPANLPLSVGGRYVVSASSQIPVFPSSWRGLSHDTAYDPVTLEPHARYLQVRPIFHDDEDTRDWSTKLKWLDNYLALRAEKGLPRIAALQLRKQRYANNLGKQQGYGVYKRARHGPSPAERVQGPTQSSSSSAVPLLLQPRDSLPSGRKTGDSPLRGSVYSPRARRASSSTRRSGTSSSNIRSVDPAVVSPALASEAYPRRTTAAASFHLLSSSAISSPSPAIERVSESLPQSEAPPSSEPGLRMAQLSASSSVGTAAPVSLRLRSSGRVCSTGESRSSSNCYGPSSLVPRPTRIPSASRSQGNSAAIVGAETSASSTTDKRSRSRSAASKHCSRGDAVRGSSAGSGGIVRCVKRKHPGESVGSVTALNAIALAAQELATAATEMEAAADKLGLFSTLMPAIGDAARHLQKCAQAVGASAQFLVAAAEQQP